MACPIFFRNLCAAAALAACATASSVHAGTQDDARGFAEGSSLNLLNRLLW